MSEATIPFAVRNRWSGEVQFTAQIACSVDAIPSIKLGLAVRWARANRADLSRADLSGADLRGAVLSDADLRGADLRGADLRGADLRRADLRRADLSDADLRGADLSRADLSRAVLRDADLSGADLRDAVLRDADLSGAVLRDADLSGADLSRADLRGAVLRDADLRAFKADLWLTLAQSQAEIPGLVAALQEGRIDGSCYSGACACLVGTIANVRGVPVSTLDRGASRPAEQWFAMIRPGDKPGDDTGGGFAAKQALDWTLEYCRLHGINTDAAKFPTHPLSQGGER